MAMLQKNVKQDAPETIIHKCHCALDAAICITMGKYVTVNRYDTETARKKQPDSYA